MNIKNLNLGLVICLILGSLMAASPAKAQTTEWPPDGFWNEPSVPSIFDQVSFGLYDFPPAEWKCTWNFGDGTTYNECWVNASKQYKADGDYTVSILVTNELEQTKTVSRVVSVRTHDVAITKFTVPQSASAGQTRQLVVSVRNSRYPETVQVELYRSTANGFAMVGSLIQEVPVRSANRTTAFSFNYTFTADDAQIGKLIFKAVATLPNHGGGDDFPADNEIIALPTRLSR
jgi:hypothetical protein